MSAWFHFGVVQRDDFWYDEALKQPPPIQFEDRLDEVHLPRSEIDGTPDLIIFDSAYCKCANSCLCPLSLSTSHWKGITCILAIEVIYEIKIWRYRTSETA